MTLWRGKKATKEKTDMSLENNQFILVSVSYFLLSLKTDCLLKINFHMFHHCITADF